MKWLSIMLVLSSSPMFAQNRNLQGYVINAAAFRKIQSFCVDTHNLPPDQTDIINRFLVRESKAKGLLTKLPWRRRPTCQDPGIDAIVRLEFPPDDPFTSIQYGDVEGVLLVFRPGSPTPIYETPGVITPGRGNSPFEKFVTGLLQYNAAHCAVEILIHDWQRK